MKQREDDFERVTPEMVNPGYAALHIAKALTTSEEHEDPATRERARQRIAKWETVLRNILTGAVSYGTRTPVASTPPWATLEVVTGGFATGELLAAGPLQEHENRLLETLLAPVDGKPRKTLNVYFLTDAGIADLRDKLRSNCYDIGVPEEGALLVVAWLVEKGHTDAARALLDELSPYFSELRFYPIPTAGPRRFGSRVHLQNVGTTIEDLLKIRPNHRVLAQKEASQVWAPYYDRMIQLFLETVVNGWPCQHYPEDWQERARTLVGQYADLRNQHSLCGKPERRRKHFFQLREFLRRCTVDPASLTGREVGKIRLILNQAVARRGAPDSTRCVEARHRQLAAVSGPTFQEISRVVVPRLERHSKADGLDEVSHLKRPVGEEEAAGSRVPQGTPIPFSIQRKVDRCLNETIDVLIERDLITSGETLARVLPQLISGLRAAGVSDPELRQLYGLGRRLLCKAIRALS